MVAQAPTEVKLAVDTTASEAPVPLTQAVLNTGSGSLSELQLPARFNVLNAFTDVPLSFDQQQRQRMNEWYSYLPAAASTIRAADAFFLIANQCNSDQRTG